MSDASRPALSIVVPCYNYARFLPECLDSIFAQQDAPGFEVIAIDDGSTDDTGAVLEGYRDPRLTVVRHAVNLGHVATINEGLSLARGDVIARIDPDDRYRPHFMATVVRTLQSHPDVGLVYGLAAIVDERGQQTGSIGLRPHEGDFTGSELVALLERNFICAPTVAARRDIWLAALPAPEGLAFNDWYFTLMAARQTPFHFVDDILADYRVHGQNHHTRVARDGSEERSVIWLLDRVYAESEHDGVLERTKRAAKGRVYGAHYLDFAEKYFSFGLSVDARRCYVKALRARPALALRRGVARRMLAALTSRRLYERLKQAWKSASSPRGPARGAAERPGP